MITNDYGAGVGIIWLFNVDCLGSENSLDECSHAGWGVHYCLHDHDVAIECDPPENGILL